MTKKSAKKRIVIKPNFVPQVPMLDTPGLRQLAKREHLDVPQKIIPGKRKETLEQLGGHFIGRQRRDVSVKNTSEFYLHLYLAIEKERLIRNNRATLFPKENINISWDSYFYPDFLIVGEDKISFGEVKSISVNGGKPFFGYRQLAGYIRSLLENPGANIVTGIFKYGKSRPCKYYVCHKEDEHKCDNRCLAKNLSKTTRSLLVIPDNLLAFLVMLPYPQEMDQRKTRRGGGKEIYKRPYGEWLTYLVDHWDNPGLAIGKILKHAKSKNLGLVNFSLDDFFLDNLEAERVTSSKNIYCRSHRGFPMYNVTPFNVVRYKNETYTTKTSPHDDWIDYLRNNLDDFLEGLGIKEVYYERLERVSIANVKTTPLPDTPKDGIPI